MSPRNLFLLLIAGIFAIGTVMFVRAHMEKPAPAPVALVPKAQRILAAKQDIPAGSFVKAGQDLQWAEWPAAGIQPTYVKEGNETIQNYEGAVARHTIHSGEAIITTELVKPGSGGFLSAVLEPGMRAVSVAVSATSGTGGFIFPGDRVDLIVTHHMKVKNMPGSDEEDAVVSETFIRDVRVVAVDQMLDNPDNKAILAKTVTVEVTSTQAQGIGVAQDLGKISFALRSLASAAPPPAAAPAEGGPLEPINGENQDMVSAITAPQLSAQESAVTRDTDISPSLMHRGDVSPRIRVIRGDQSEQREFYGDGQ